jgi:AcrR family transcriptional regulator
MTSGTARATDARAGVDSVADNTTSASTPDRAPQLATEPGQARARATRRALLVAAAQRFYAAGYQAASLTDIADDAEVTKGALYFHFPNKRALADAVITDMNATWTAMVSQVITAGQDPLTAMLAITDQAVAHLLSDPVARGGTRLLHDPLLRSSHTTEAAAHQYRHAAASITTQLAAAGHAGLLRPQLSEHDPAQLALARTVIATITGHHMICDVTGADTQLWDHTTAMWQQLLPIIATDPWLQHWQASDWPHRPHPRPTH